MDGARNLLLATCKERNLRKLDPNIDDKFLSFKTTNMSEYGIQPGDLAIKWKPLQQTSNYELITSADIAPTRNRSGLVVNFEPGKYITGAAHPVFQMNEPDQKEFYFRTSLWPRVTGGGSSRIGDSRLVFGVKEGDSYNLSLYVKWVSASTLVATFNWKSESGEAKSLSTAPFNETGWTALRVFIREDSVTLQRDSVNVKVPFTGVRKASASATLELYKPIGEVATQTNVSNIGFGGFIAEAPPEPKVV